MGADRNDAHCKASLAFRDCTYTVTTTEKGRPVSGITKSCVKTKDRQLLRNINASVDAGHVLAILGPSGAGKTTLLNMLVLNDKGGKPEGEILLNGQPFTNKMYINSCAYVQQHDTLWPSLTAREHLEFAYDLYQPELSAHERTQKVDAALAAVHLTAHQHTKAGSIFMRGLSGGLKRRLSIALALAKKPQVLFLDEPTSGVDSASAALIMSLLSDLARAEAIAVLCTIHQPSASVYDGFDNVLVLASGRTAYCGAVSSLVPHFAALGQKFNPGTNPAEFVLDLVNKDFTSPEKVDALLNAWEEEETDGAATDVVNTCDILKAKRPGFVKQVAVLLKRGAYLTVREPMLYTGRIALILASNIFFAIVYIKTRDLVQEQALSRFFFVLFCLGTPAFYSIAAVFAYNMEQNAYVREVKDGMYSPAAVALSNFVLQTPMTFVLGFVSALPTYAIGNLHWPSFPAAWAIWSTCLWCFEGMAMFFSLVANPLLGMLMFMNVWFSSFLFSGMFVRIEDVIWPFRLACYATPLGWTTTSLMYVVMIDTPEYDGAEPCDESRSFCDRGFYCPDDPTGQQCYGYSGAQILDSVGKSYSIISSENNVARDMAIVIAIGVVFRFFYFVQLRQRCYSSAEPKAPSARKGAKNGDKESLKIGAAVPQGVTSTKKSLSNGSKASSKESGNQSGGSNGDPNGVNGVNDLNETAIAIDACTPTQPDADARQPTSFVFKSCSYSVLVNDKGKAVGGVAKKCAKKTSYKKLISNVSAKVEPGEVLAIMGPSGSGKTTLLNLLTLEEGAGIAHGSVTLNGNALTLGLYPKYFGYVPRDDVLWASLTVRQHLSDAFSLYRPKLNAAARDAAIDTLLHDTGMVSCQHTKAGNEFFKGLSGGQRRRLALALLMVKQPQVLILDEPTSGLDSKAAQAIVSLLKDLATRRNLNVICTIHQPSAAVYAIFDRVLMLSEGRVAFSDEAARMSDFYGSLGKPPPPTANPAEYVVDLVSKDLQGAESVIALLDAWEERESQVHVPKQTPLQPAEETASFCSQVATLTKRAALLSIKEPILYTARIFSFVFISVFFGIIYVSSRDQVQEQVLSRVFYLWWTSCCPSSLSAIAVFALNIEANVVRTEVKNGMYSPLAYIISNTALQVPMMCIMSLALLVPSYAIGNWPWTEFGYAFVGYALMLWAWECIAQFLSLMKNPLLGMLSFLNFWFTGILFTGLVFRGSDVIWPFRTLYYILPYKWFFNLYAYSIFIDAEYSGTEPCTPDPANSFCPNGFYCPADNSALACFGKTGKQMLDSLNSNYESITADDERLVDLVVILAIALVFKFLFSVQFYFKCKAAHTPREGDADKPARNRPQLTKTSSAA